VGNGVAVGAEWVVRNAGGVYRVDVPLRSEYGLVERKWDPNRLRRDSGSPKVRGWSSELANRVDVAKAPGTTCCSHRRGSACGATWDTVGSSFHEEVRAVRVWVQHGRGRMRGTRAPGNWRRLKGVVVDLHVCVVTVSPLGLLLSPTRFRRTPGTFPGTIRILPPELPVNPVDPQVKIPDASFRLQVRCWGCGVTVHSQSSGQLKEEPPACRIRGSGADSWP